MSRIDELYGIAEDGYSRYEDNHGGITALQELATIAREAIAERDALHAQRDWLARQAGKRGCPNRRCDEPRDCRQCWIDAAKEATK